MKKWIILPILLSLTSCSMTENEDFYNINQQAREEIDSFELPRHAINDVVKGLAFQMLDNSAFVNTKAPVAVASFVNLKDLESTNWLGNQLSERFVHELQRHGLLIVDFKTTGHIRVTKDGDYVLSRDWQELPERQIIDYVVTGTMIEQAGGVIVNARMIGIESKVVVATAQAFIPAWVIGDEFTHQQNINNSVKMKDGMIIRSRAKLPDNERGIGIHQ